MTHSGHSQKKRHRRSAFRRFFDRLRGKKSHVKAGYRSDFPGISLPRNYDPNVSHVDKDEKVLFMESDPIIKEPLKSIPKQGEDKLEEFKASSIRFKPSRKKKWKDSVDLYLKKRILRKEERKKKRLKNKLRREHQKEYRKKEAGRSFLKKLFSHSEESEADKKKVTLLSQRSPFFRTMTISLNSTMIFMVTYVLVYLFYWLICMLVASWYGLDSTLYYYDLKFNDHSTLWNRFNILLVTGISPVMCLVVGIYLLRRVIKKSRWVGLQKLFILWTGFHLINHFFGAFPSGVVTAEGFGYVAAWLYMNTAFKFMFSILSLSALAAIGYYSAQLVLETSDSINRIKSEHRISFIFTQLALPWIIGTVMLLLIRLPMAFDYPYETFMFFSMVFLVIPPFFNEKVKPKLNLLKIKKRRYVNLGYFAMMLVLLAFLRIMLGIGLHFVIEINISITPASG